MRAHYACVTRRTQTPLVITTRTRPCLPLLSFSTSPPTLSLAHARDDRRSAYVLWSVVCGQQHSQHTAATTNNKLRNNKQQEDLTNAVWLVHFI